MANVTPNAESYRELAPEVYSIAWRYVDWAWRESERLASEPTLESIAPNDRWIVAATEFLRSEAAGVAPAIHRTVAQAIAVARRIWEEGGLERDILEARLLSGQSHQEIADKSRLTRFAVEAFEQLSFRFRPFRKATNWICVRAIRAHVNCTSKPEIGVVLRKYGYFSGPVALERLVQTVVKLRPDSLIADLDFKAVGQDVNAEELAVRKLLAMELLPMTPSAFILNAHLGFEHKCRNAHYAAATVEQADAAPTDWRAKAIQSAVQMAGLECNKRHVGTASVA